MKYSLFFFIAMLPVLLFSQTTTFSPEELKEDIDHFQKVLYECHPSAFRYYPKDTLTIYFDRFRQKANEGMTAHEFEREARIILSKIACIHTTAKKKKLPKKKRKKQVKRKIIPFLFYTNGQQLWTKKALVDNLEAAEWCEVLQIDNKPVPAIIQKISTYRTADGYGDTYMKQVLNYSKNFNVLYTYYFDNDSLLQLQLVNEKKDTFPFKVAAISNQKLPKAAKKDEKWDVDIKNHHFKIEDNTAFLKIDGFHVGKIKRHKFYKNLFKTLEVQNIPNLVIDLRGNGGGNINEANLLLSYILDEAFTYDLVRHKSKLITYAKPVYTFGSFFNGMLRMTKPHTQKEGKKYIKYTMKSKEKYNFDGQVYLLIDGLTASSSTVVASYLKHTVNAITIGEETGGGAAGNNGLFYPKVRLSNTKLELKIPYYWIDYQLIIDKGRGVLPDFPISYTINDIKAEKDLEMEKVRAILGRKK